MLHGHENLLQIAHLSQACVDELTPSFDALPHTKHADGDYRLRRYSVVTLNGDKVVEEDQHTFVQTSDINHFQGDVVRRFEPLELNTLNSKGLLEMCQIFSEANELEDGHPIEIHQMRIDAIYDETPVAPEGVHQDGFDAIALVGIHRHNIVGGEVMLYEDSHQAPFFRKVLNDGEITLLDDHDLWHNAQPIYRVDSEQEGHMDVFVLTAHK
ncbi:hypothetical protein JCM19241_3326 [Vibrio ishigakensis]|uniref:Agglutination protein n=1 Tax=Vibrio ishigakensis TaxID=1481914 RepID=A0A0B8QLX4_9VIBR|nr:hypothetical protein JCM19241_3326 [Vibrio ishigakensis]